MTLAEELLAPNEAIQGLSRMRTRPPTSDDRSSAGRREWRLGWWRPSSLERRKNGRGRGKRIVVQIGADAVSKASHPILAVPKTQTDSCNFC